MGPGNKRAEPTVDSFDFIRGEVPPPPEWTANASLDWSAAALEPGDPVGIAFETSWATPVYDLRPDLASRIGTTKQGFPIWRRYARLRIQLAGLRGGAFAFGNIRITATTFVQVFDANVQSSAIGTPAASSPRPNLLQLDTTDVTTAFSTVGTLPAPATGFVQSSLGEFPFRGNTLGGGEGYPIRYMRIAYTFRTVVETGVPIPGDPASVAPDVIALSAAVY
jgi:hypothetical protein